MNQQESQASTDLKVASNTTTTTTIIGECYEFHVISSKSKAIILKNRDLIDSETRDLNSEISSSLESFCNCLSPVMGDDDGQIFRSWSLPLNFNLMDQLLLERKNVDRERLLWCCNYVIGMNEDFIRIDKTLTRVSDEEREDDYQICNSTRIESGHAILCQDGLEYAECAGEMRVRYLGRDCNGGGDALFEIVSVNLQSSFFAFPEDKLLKAWNKFNVDGRKLYKTNYWEMKGRAERFKYVN